MQAQLKYNWNKIAKTFHSCFNVFVLVFYFSFISAVFQLCGHFIDPAVLFSSRSEVDVITHFERFRAKLVHVLTFRHVVSKKRRRQKTRSLKCGKIVKQAHPLSNSDCTAETCITSLDFVLNRLCMKLIKANNFWIITALAMNNLALQYPVIWLPVELRNYSYNIALLSTDY